MAHNKNKVSHLWWEAIFLVFPYSFGKELKVLSHSTICLKTNSMHIVSLTVGRTQVYCALVYRWNLIKLNTIFIEGSIKWNACELTTRSIYCSMASKGHFLDTVKSNQNHQHFHYILGISLKIHRFASWISTATITVLLLLFAIFSTKFDFFYSSAWVAT